MLYAPRKLQDRLTVEDLDLDVDYLYWLFVHEPPVESKSYEVESTDSLAPQP